MALLACKGLTFKTFLSGVCACLNFGLTLTLIASMNMLFTDWLASFGGNRGGTAAVQATCLSVAFAAGLLAGMVERKLGERVSLLLGTALATAGFLAGGFVTSLPALIVCVGVVTGSGFCLIHLCSISTILMRFPQKAGFLSSAMAICASLMHLVSPLLYRYFSEQYTWRGALILAGGIILHTAIFSLLLTSPLLQSSTTEPPRNSSTPSDHDGTLFIPSSDVTDTTAATFHHSGELRSVEAKHNEDRDRHNILKKTSFDTDVHPPVADTAKGKLIETRCNNEDTQDKEEELVPLEPLTETSEHSKNLCPLLPNQEPADDTEKHVAATCLSRFKSKVAFLKDPLYICVLLCTVVPLSVFVCFLFLLLDFVTFKGWSMQDGILLNLTFHLSGLFTRVFAGAVSLHKRVRSIAVLIAAAMVGSVGVCFLGQVSSFPLAALVFASLGFGAGGLLSVYPAAVLEVTGPGPAYPVALGLVCTIQGVLDAGVGILTGVVVDMLQSYSMISLVYGVICLASSLLLLVVFLCRRSRSSEV